MNVRDANSRDSKRSYKLKESKVRYKVGSVLFKKFCPNCGSLEIYRYYEDGSLYCFDCSYGYDQGKDIENRYIRESGAAPAKKTDLRPRLVKRQAEI